MFEQIEISEHVYKMGALSKKRSGQMPTLTVMSGNKRN